MNHKSFNFKNLKDYEKLVDSESISKERNKESHVEKFKTGNLLPGLNFFSETINVGDINDYADKNALYCGIYVEKFLLEDNEYKFLCSKFYLNRIRKSGTHIIPKIEGAQDNIQESRTETEQDKLAFELREAEYQAGSYIKASERVPKRLRDRIKKLKEQLSVQESRSDTLGPV